MISVCMATYNGEKYIRDQIISILSQLDENDELVISDDGSTDQTRLIVNSFEDLRVKLIVGPKKGLIKNFENSLNNCQGDIIFLADQDDVWSPEKVELMLDCLKTFDLAVSDCIVTDANLNSMQVSFFEMRRSGKGFLKNIVRNSYLGCCMAFKRKLLTKALPFPDNIPMHDWWLGLIAETHFKPCFVREKLLLYRRHENNNSPTSEKSNTDFFTLLKWRIILLIRIAISRVT